MTERATVHLDINSMRFMKKKTHFPSKDGVVSEDNEYSIMNLFKHTHKITKFIQQMGGLIFQFKANSRIVQTIILESAVGESQLKLKDESNEHFLSGGLTLRLRTPAISILECQILSFFNVNLCFKFTDFYCEN